MKFRILLNYRVLKSILTLGVPISLQGFLLSSLSVVDGIMIAGLGDAMLSAIGIGSRWFWFISILLFSCISGASILLSQFSEREDLREYRDIAIVCFLSLAIASIVISSIFIFYPSIPISAFTVAVDVEVNASFYVQCIGVLTPLTALCLFFGCIFIIEKKSTIPLFAVAVEVILNITINYALIYGKFGLPQLGIIGAGIGSIIARIVRISILLGFFNFTALMNTLRTQYNNLRVDRKSFYIYYNVVAPVAISSILWGAGLFVIQLIYSSISEKALTIISLVTPLEVVGMTLVGGVISSASIIIGKQLGNHEYDQAEITKKNAIFLSIVIGFLVGTVVSLIGGIVVSASELSESVKDEMHMLLPVIILSVVLRSISSMQMQAILKSGGDVNFCFKLDVSCQWLISLPIIGISVFFLNVELVHIMLIALVEDIMKLIISYYRIKKYNWKRTLHVHEV